MKVIYDCDNTTGIPQRDVDDGLTLLYLVKEPQVELLGNTLTFGNGTVQEVEHCTEKMAELFQLNIPTFIGLEKNVSFRLGKPSPAAKFMIEAIKKYPQQITILATGSQNNLAEVELFEPGLLQKTAQIVIMGGIFQPLMINGVAVDELNLSISNEAAQTVLNSQANITLVSGQYILDGILSRKNIDTGLVTKDNPGAKWLKSVLDDWFDENIKMWNLDGTINWDGVTAFAFLQPEQFIFKDVYIEPTPKDLKHGMIKLANLPNGHKINLVYQIKDMSVLNDLLLQRLNSYFE